MLSMGVCFTEGGDCILYKHLLLRAQAARQLTSLSANGTSHAHIYMYVVCTCTSELELVTPHHAYGLSESGYQVLKNTAHASY